MAARVNREDAPIALGRRGLEPDPRHVPEVFYDQHGSIGGGSSIGISLAVTQRIVATMCTEASQARRDREQS